MVESVAILSIVFAYLAWQRAGFDKITEISQATQVNLNNVYTPPGLKYNYTFPEVGVHEPGFPEGLYKYIPFIKREGFADIRVIFYSNNEDSFDLPSKMTIESHETFPPSGVEIRSTSWDQGEDIDYGEMLVRVYEMDPIRIYNAVKIVLLVIHELNIGEDSQQLRRQLRYIDSSESLEE